MIWLSAQGWRSHKEKLGQGPIYSGASRTYLELLLYSDSRPLPGSGLRVGCVCVETPASQLPRTSPIPPYWPERQYMKEELEKCVAVEMLVFLHIRTQL